MRFIHNHLYPLIAVLTLITAAIFWYGSPLPVPPKKLAPIAEPWSLPKLAEHDSAKSIDAINARNLWGTIEANAPKEPEWKVLGIARSGEERFILLAYEGKPTERLQVGDVLPDGAKIVQIEKDRFYVLTADKKKLVFGIYKHAPAK